MWPSHEPVAWDEWGRPWAFINIGMNDLPNKEDTCFLPLGNGCTLKAVLVRHDLEPYYFPSAQALLVVLQRNALDQDKKIPPLALTGWTPAIRDDVEQLLQPIT